MLLKIIKILITGILVSFYFFPFEFSFLPGLNTKMAMAAMGIVLCIIQMARQRSIDIPKGIFLLFLSASLISLVGLISVVYNNTPDYSYVSYIISMSVWLSAAYVLCSIIRYVHGSIEIRTIIYYLLAVCVAQCALALMIDNMPAFKRVVDTYIMQDQAFLNKVERLYGIGAWLDVAGARFATVIIAGLFLAFHERETLPLLSITLIFLAIAIIFLCGNMISRTTTVGLIGFVYAIFATKVWIGQSTNPDRRFWSPLFIIILIVVAVSVTLYAISPGFKELTRFAFEGFFNLAESGKWETSSTGKLQTMFVFPETLKTWIIGDGYFVNPNRTDPNYLGEFRDVLGFYMGTDVGFLRFIFYFGIIGLTAFILFISYSCKLCCCKSPEYTPLFLLTLLCGLVVWLKVASDVFFIFALYICIGYMNQDSSTV